MNRRQRRYYRTVLLGVAAMGTLIWAAIDQFDIPPADMLHFFLVSILATAVVIVCAALVAGLWLLLRSALRRGRER